MSSKWAYIILAFIGGVCISPQGAINAMLGRYVGNLQAGIVSFAVGLTALLVVALVTISQLPGTWSRILEAPKYAFTGGVLGAIIVLTTLLAVPRIGATATVLGILIGQIVSSVLIDHYGLFEVPLAPFQPLRILGFILLVLALPLVV